jgi:hypothetical protein
MDKIILKPWCFIGLDYCLYDIIDKSYIKIIPSNNIQNSNCILMSFLEYFDCNRIWNSTFNYFKKNYNPKFFDFKSEIIKNSIDDIVIRDFFLEKKELMRNKKIIFRISAESFNSELNFIIDDLIKNFDVNPSDIIILDSTSFSRGYTRPFYSPIELIIKNHFHIYYNLDCRYDVNKILHNSRNKKICFNNFKYSEFRMHSLLSMFSCYENMMELFKDNEVTAYDFKYKTNYREYVEIDKNCIIDVNFPIRYQSELDIDYSSEPDMYKEVFNSLKKSYFSIITETNNNLYNLSNENIPMEDLLSKDRVQISEKTINPFICGNLPFIIENYDFYRALMDVGYDFTYLEIEFGIDYKNNKIEDNFLKIKEFTNTLKNMSIEDIEKIRQKYMNTIINNYNITVNALNGKLTNNSYEYLKSRLL